MRFRLLSCFILACRNKVFCIIFHWCRCFILFVVKPMEVGYIWLFPYFYCCYILFDRHLTLLQYDESNTYDFLGYCIVCFVVLYGALTIKVVRRILEAKTLAYIGKISFALYTIHMIVFWSIGSYIFQVLKFLAFAYRFCFTFIVCFVLSIVIANLLTKIDNLWVKKIKGLKFYFSKAEEKQCNS